MAGEQRHPEPTQRDDQGRAQQDSGGLESYEVDDQRWETDASREQPRLGERIARGEIPPPMHEPVERAYPKHASDASQSEAGQGAGTPDQERRDELAMPTETAATEGERPALARQGGTMHATDTEQQTPRGRRQRTKQQAQEQQQDVSTMPTSEEASRTADAPAEAGKRGRTRKSAAQGEDTGQDRHDGNTATEQPPRRRSSTRTAKAPASQEQLETSVVPAAANGGAAEPGRAQSEEPQPEPAQASGSIGVAEEALPREQHELQPSGQPVGVQIPSSPNAGALRDARTRVGNVIDRFASQIPYGEQFADEAKRAANQALDHLEAQAARRAAGLHRDLGAQPGATPGAPG